MAAPKKQPHPDLPKVLEETDRAVAEAMALIERAEEVIDEQSHQRGMALRRAYDHGATVEALGKRYGISHQRVSHLINRAGEIERKRNAAAKAEKENSHA